MSRRQVPRRNPEAGLTLVEMLVALAVFALIGAAGLSVLDGILRAQAGTEGRLESLARMQRAMHLVATDLMQASGSSVSASGTGLSFRREDGPVVAYALEDRALVRQVSRGGDGPPARQVLLAQAEAVTWRFFTPELGWIAEWPPVAAAPRTDVGGADGGVPVRWRNPAAVELGLALAGPGAEGTLRRVAILPAEVSP